MRKSVKKTRQGQTTRKEAAEGAEQNRGWRLLLGGAHRHRDAQSEAQRQDETLPDVAQRPERSEADEPPTISEPQPLPDTSSEIETATEDTAQNVTAEMVENPPDPPVTDQKEDDNMQTAKQIKPISDSNIAKQAEAKDAAPAKVSPIKSAPMDEISSLFGPIIEDDAKGVRSQIRELIQCELQGELGQRFSRNLRIVIRREIAAAVEDQYDRV